MAAITKAYFPFSGDGFLTLLNPKTLIGKSTIEYEDANGDWKRVNGVDGNPLTIGWSAETIEVRLPEGATNWRVVVSYRDCDTAPTAGILSFYNADLDNQPDYGPFPTAGNPYKPRPTAKNVTTYYETFTGSGVMVLSDPGGLVGRPVVEVSDGQTWSPYHGDDGLQVGFDIGGEAVEFKSTADFRVVYQVADCWSDRVVVWAFTPYVYTLMQPPTNSLRSTKPDPKPKPKPKLKKKKVSKKKKSKK